MWLWVVVVGVLCVRVRVQVYGRQAGRLVWLVVRGFLVGRKRGAVTEIKSRGGGASRQARAQRRCVLARRLARRAAYAGMRAHDLWMPLAAAVIPCTKLETAFRCCLSRPALSLLQVRRTHPHPLPSVCPRSRRSERLGADNAGLPMTRGFSQRPEDCVSVCCVCPNSHRPLSLSC